MKLCRRKQGKESWGQPNDEVAYKIALRIISAQKRLAVFLGKKASCLPRWFLLSAFLICFLTAAFYYGYVLLRALN